MDTTPGIDGGVQAPEAGGQRRPLAAAILVAVLFVAMIGLSIWYLTRAEPLVIQGEVQSHTFDMAARVDGRIARILVARSENVQRGAPLLRIENPELLARLKQNEAELAVARAELARIEAGFRAETIAVRRAQVDRAAADLTLALQTYDRVRQLAADRFAPRAQLDQATAALTVAQRGLEQARFSYNEAVTGFIPEEHAIAKAKVAAAAAALETTQALVDQMVVIAPADSQVFRIPSEPGEVAEPGIPLLSLADLSDLWVQFDLREDLLRGLSPGAKLRVRVPALQDRTVELEIRVIAPRGEYTGWRATRATGDFDLRTFEVRAYPAVPVPGLRPGMSVYADWSEPRR